MAKFPSFGGTITLALDGGGAASYPVRSVNPSYSRQSLEATELGDYRERGRPGRVKRVVSFELYAQDGTADDALKTHMYPASLSAAVNAAAVLVYTDAAGKVFTVTGYLTMAERRDEGAGMAVWSCALEES